METTKECSKCGEVKLAGEFPAGRLRCKQCAVEYQRQWREKNAEKNAEWHRQWREKNPDKVAEWHLRYRQKNPDKAAERDRQWREKNPDRVTKMRRQWCEKNPDKVAENRLRYSQKNVERIVERGRRYRERLEPNYVADVSGIPAAELNQHPELLEMKRLVIRARRVVRSIQKELKK